MTFLRRRMDGPRDAASICRPPTVFIILASILPCCSARGIPTLLAAAAMPSVGVAGVTVLPKLNLAAAAARGAMMAPRRKLRRSISCYLRATLHRSTALRLRHIEIRRLAPSPDRGLEAGRH